MSKGARVSLVSQDLRDAFGFRLTAHHRLAMLAEQLIFACSVDSTNESDAHQLIQSAGIP